MTFRNVGPSNGGFAVAWPVALTTAWIAANPQLLLAANFGVPEKFVREFSDPRALHASASGEACPTQSLMLNVPNSEK